MSVEYPTKRTESAPRLRLAEVNARTIGEAMEKMRKDGAGEEELQEMQTWLNANRTSKTAFQWRKFFNFFPNAADAGSAPCLSSHDDAFSRFRGWADRGWCSGGRAVLRD